MSKTQCIMCQRAAASVYCVNDDAHLCSDCDVSFHSNALAARHERRPLACCPEGASVAPDATSSDADFAVVPQFAPTSDNDTTFRAQPIVLDDFFGPAGGGIPATFIDPEDDDDAMGLMRAFESELLEFDADDCVVPQMHGGLSNVFAPGALPFSFNADPMRKLAYASNKIAPMMVPQDVACDYDDQEEEEEEDDDETWGRNGAVKREPAPEPELSRTDRVARYKEKRARRNFKKTIRYQSRKAYAEVRPRIKGRFVSPEEYAAWRATQDAGAAVVPAC
jgi:hypothetical protein